jgi:cyclic di-GMP phosphodiesterase
MENKKFTVLIVDDEAANIAILVEILQKDYKLQVAPDGETALKIVKKKKPDLILLDIMMPGINGYEVCRIIKDDQLTSDIPVIFVTAMDDDYDEFRGRQLGAADFIKKPYDPNNIKCSVQDILG